jgi:hypothetical protein
MTNEAEHMRVFNERFKEFREEKRERLLDMLATQVAELFLRQCCSDMPPRVDRGRQSDRHGSFDEEGKGRYSENDKPSK